MIKGVIVLSAMLGITAFLIADILRPDSGETSAYVDTWPVQHPVYFGVGVGLVVLMIGMLSVIASNTKRPPSTSD